MKKKILIILLALFAVIVMFFVACPVQDENWSGQKYWVTFPEAYARSNGDWGSSSTFYTLKFVFLRNEVVANLTKDSTSSSMMSDTTPGYVFGDNTVGNGKLTISTLDSSTSVTKSNRYVGVYGWKQGTDLVIEIVPTFLGKYYRLYKDIDTGPDGQDPDNVVGGTIKDNYTPCVVGSITMNDDASLDKNCIGALWFSWLLKMEKEPTP